MNSETEVSSEAMTAWARLFRVSQSMLAAADAELKAHGFPPLVWYDALLELRRVGTEGMRPFELQRAMLLAQYNVSRLLDRLVAADYVERRTYEEDKRGQTLAITPAGRELLENMWPVYQSIMRKSFADRLEEADIADLNRIFKMLDNA